MLLEDLAAEKRRLGGLKAQSREFLSHAPEGSLRISRRDDHAYYYHRETKSDRRGTYLPKKDVGLAAQLAGKSYASRLLAKIEEAEPLIDELAACFYPSCEGDLARFELEGGFGECRDFVEESYLALSEERRRLVVPFEEPVEDFVARWESEEYQAKSFYEGDPYLFSDKHERMRSKSEVLIANKLRLLGVPYRYECELYLEGMGFVYPDFTVLNKRERRVYVWEHMGMMDDPSYAEKALKKLEAYSRSGYIPGVNLIVTHERSACPLDTRLVEAIASARLL